MWVPMLYGGLKLIMGVLLFNRVRRQFKRHQDTMHDSLDLMAETMAQAETVKALGLRSTFEQKWHAITRKQIHQNRHLHQLTELAMTDHQGLRQVGFLVWLWVAAQLVAQGHPLTVGQWVGCSVLVTWVLHPLSTLPALSLQWLQAQSALLGIDRILKMQVDPSEDVIQPHMLTLKGHVHLDKVSCAHAGHAQGLEVSRLIIKAGERVVLTGKTGGGKTTLLKLIGGLYAPVRGQVLIDHVNVAHIARTSLSAHIGYLPHEVQLISGTLRDNLLAGLSGVGDAELLSWCERLGLMPLVNAHPLGLAVNVGAEGHGTSMGQRQLIGLARLLLRQPRIWLLDDPLSHLDEMLQQRVLNLLKSTITGEQTVVMVTQHPVLLQWADRCVLIESGRVVMDGLMRTT